MHFFNSLTQPTQNNLACYHCRIVENDTDIARQNHCPTCGHVMYNMGAGFMPPNKSDKVEWNKVALLVKHNFTFEYIAA